MTRNNQVFLAPDSFNLGGFNSENLADRGDDIIGGNFYQGLGPRVVFRHVCLEGFNNFFGNLKGDGASVDADVGRVGEIGRGLLLLVAVERGDGPAQSDFLSRKIANLRIFPDAEGKMNRSLLDVKGEALVVSQFTLVAEWGKGNRPSFTTAALPEEAVPLLDRFIAGLEAAGIRTQRGKFGAHMAVNLCNDGPVTIILDSSELERPRRG